MKLLGFIILFVYLLFVNSISAYEIVFDILLNGNQSIIKNINDTKSNTFSDSNLKISQYILNNLTTGSVYTVQIYIIVGSGGSGSNEIASTPIVVNETLYFGNLDLFSNISLLVVKDYSFQVLDSPELFIIDGSNSQGYFLNINGAFFQKYIVVSGIQFINWKRNNIFLVKNFQDSTLDFRKCIFKESTFVYRFYILMCYQLLLDTCDFININSGSFNLYFNSVYIYNSTFSDNINNSIQFNNISSLVMSNNKFFGNIYRNQFIEIKSSNSGSNIVLDNISIYNNTASSSNRVFSFLIDYNSSNHSITFNNVHINNSSNSKFQNIVNLSNSTIYINNSNIPSNNYTVLGSNNKIYSYNSTHNALSQLFCNLINNIVYECNNSSNNSNNNNNRIRLIIAIALPVSITLFCLFILIIFIKKKKRYKAGETKKRLDSRIVHGVIEESLNPVPQPTTIISTSIATTIATSEIQNANLQDDLPTFLNEIELVPMETIDEF